jgi:threonine aldolase
MALISFGSDNHSGVHPLIMQALNEANTAYAPSYGMDEMSLNLQKQLREDLKCHDAHMVFTGTAANVLCLATAIKSFESVLCTDISHLNEDECGAPEKFLGAKLIGITHKDGKLPLTDLSQYLVRRGDQHSSQIKMISITQPTEYGTLYSLDELRELRRFCDKEKLLLHIDGARLANACFTLDCTFKDIIQYSDVTSLGGAKNGLLLGELVIINSPTLKENFKFLRKQAMQLPSKTRFLAAQFTAYFANNLWKEIAAHQCQMAQYLGERIQSLPGLSVNYAVQSNAVFCNLPQKLIKPLREEFFFYVWKEATFECRIMTSFNTKKEDIDQFISKLETLL